MNYNTILIVDDNATTVFYNTDVVSEVFPKATVHAYEQSTNFIAEYLTNFSNDKDPILVLLDISMPGQIGFEVLEELEKDFPELPNLHVVMVTSSSLKGDMERSTKHTCVIGYIEKPLTAEKLILSLHGSLS
jgi:CheY-like chemotaxis protein